MFELRPRKIVCLGELLIDLVSVQGDGAPAGEPVFHKAATGASAHVAAAIAKLGGSSRFIGKIGSDAFGQFARGELEAAGVEAALVETDAASTGIALARLHEGGAGEGVPLSARETAADTLLTAAELNDDWLDDASIFHFSSLSLRAEPCRTAALEAARQVKEAGGVISYSLNLSVDTWPDAEIICLEVLVPIGLADVVKVNEDELLTRTGMEPAEAVQQLLDLGAKAVVVTRGQEGCCVITRQAMTAVPGMLVKSVDTAGAGDSFIGAMLLKLIEHGATEDILEAVLTDEQLVRDIFSFANAAGALTTTRCGVISAMPTMAEIEGLYSSYYA